jgi:arylsulfatase A-like enzyme
VLARLDKLHLAENTIVIFMSDNGGLSTLLKNRGRLSENPPTCNLPLRAGKGWLYEGGIREPMIIKWPGVTEPGSESSEPVTSTDFYPTILEMANLPQKPNQHTDGLSLVPLLTESGKLNRKALYWHYPHYSNQGGTPGGAIRSGDYKLIEFYDTDRIELYNLTEDITEKNDLSSKRPEKASELKKMLDDWRKTVKAQMPKRKEQKV